MGHCVEIFEVRRTNVRNPRLKGTQIPIFETEHKIMERYKSLALTDINCKTAEYITVNYKRKWFIRRILIF